MVLVFHNWQTWRTHTQKTNTNQIKQYYQGTNHRSIKMQPQNPSQNTNINTPTQIQTHGSISNHASNPNFKPQQQKKIQSQIK